MPLDLPLPFRFNLNSRLIFGGKNHLSLFDAVTRYAV